MKTFSLSHVLSTAVLLTGLSHAGAVMADDSIPPSVHDIEQEVVSQMLSTLTPDDPPTFRSSSLSTTCKVGTPSSQVSVSSTGGSTWQLTFDAPPAPGGLVPRMGLSYGSQSGMGIAGWGMSVSGLSVITRGVKNLYYDNTQRGMKYDAYDALYLDGVRLLRVSGADGHTGAVYHPEGDPYTKVTIKSSTVSGGAVSIEVKTPDGLTRRYGGTTNSRLRFTYGTGTRTAAWYVNHCEDANGNYADYNYFTSDGMIYPLRVDYGKNSVTNTGADNHISFSYTSLTSAEQRSFALGGTTGRITQRLASVITSTGDSIFRLYALAYDGSLDATARKYSRLTSVTVSNGRGESMNPVTLGWEGMPGATQQMSEPDAFVQVNSPGLIAADSVFVAADLNGDGIDDVTNISKVMYYLGGVWNHDTYVTVYRTCRDADTNDIYYSPLRYEGLGPQFFFDKCTNNITNNCIVDYDGDGLNDIILPWFSPNGIDDTDRVEFYVIYGKDIKAGRQYYYQQQYDFHEIVLQSSEEMPLMVTSDIDGDGLPDIILLEDGNVEGKYSLDLVRLGVGTQEDAQVWLTLPSKPKRLFTGDCNDDGLADLIVLYDGGHTIFRHNGGTDIASCYTDANSTSGTGMGYAAQAVQGDFDGDGRVDFLLAAKNSGTYRLARNQGDGTFTVTEALTGGPTATENYSEFSLTTVDIDRDGRTDAVVSKKVSGGAQVKWLLSDGEHLTVLRTVSTPSDGDAFAGNVMTGDFSGDGSSELLNYGLDWYTLSNAADGRRKLHFYRPSGITASSGLLTSVTDGMGLTTTLQYASTVLPEIYEREFSAAYPMADVHVPVTVVSQMTSEHGAVSTQTEEYRYGGLLAHLRGKGLLGFSTTQSHNLQTGETVSQGVTSWNATYYVPSATWSRTIAGTDSATVQTTMKIQAKGSKNFASRPLYMTETDFDRHVTATTYTHDFTHGHCSMERTVYDSDESMYRQRSITSFTQVGQQWLPAEIVSSSGHPDDGASFEVTTQYAYDSKGNMVSRVDNAGTDLALTTEQTFDAYGNVLSTAVSGYGVPQITSYTEYDGTGRFPVRRWQMPAGAVNTCTYDTWGFLLTSTDATEPSNPLVTVRTSDGWGGTASVTAPDGVVSQAVEQWGATPSLRYFTEAATAGHGTVRTWYDSEGRETRREEKTSGGTDVITLRAYNAKGKVNTKVRLTGTQRTEVELTSYDARGRLTRQWWNTGRTVDYTYSGRTVTASDMGRVSLKTFDAWGGTVSSTDASGNTVSYAYHSSGKPSSVTVEGTDGSSSMVTMEYDGAGNQVELDDPDAGTQTYIYAADGRMLGNTDGRGVTTVNSYDSLERISRSEVGSMSTEYFYGTSGHSALRLDSVKTGGCTESYAYDAYGRLTGRTRVYPDGKVLTHSYGYDAFSRLSTETFPSGLQTTYGYDDSGFRDSIAVAGTVLWRLVSYDGRKQTAALSNGLLLCTENDYWGRLTARYMLSPDSGERSRQLSFAYDMRGNLTSRTGVAGTGMAETFTYDDLDRLLTTSAGSAATSACAYSPGGNIISKTGLGVYTYGSSRPHAVTAVANDSTWILPSYTSLTYNDLGKTATLANSGVNTQLTYGPDGERWKMTERLTPRIQYCTWYDGSYEERGLNAQLTSWHYLGEGVICRIQNGGTAQSLFAVADNVGSYVYLVDGGGSTVFESHYDPWGKPLSTNNSISFQRGYGGHELLSLYGFWNMNGRMYDYRLGRFLSPDNYVQAPDDSQSFNRYTYCLNNPLKYTDPSGELFGIDDLIVISLVGGLSNWAINGFQSGWKGVASFFTGAGTSALSFMAGGYVANAFKTAGIITGAGAGALTGGIIGAGTNTLLGGLNNTINGSNFFDGWKKNAWSGFVNGAISGAISGAESGYWNSKEQGLNMWWGTAVKPGRSAWNFFNTDIHYDLTFDLPYVSNKTNDCLAATLTEISGDKNLYDYYLKNYNYVEDKGVELSIQDYRQILQDKFGSVSNMSGAQEMLFDPDFIKQRINDGDVITAMWKKGNYSHTDNIRKLRYYPFVPEKNKLYFRQSIFNVRAIDFKPIDAVFLIRKIKR